MPGKRCVNSQETSIFFLVRIPGTWKDASLFVSARPLCWVEVPTVWGHVLCRPSKQNVLYPRPPFFISRWELNTQHSVEENGVHLVTGNHPPRPHPSEGHLVSIKMIAKKKKKKNSTNRGYKKEGTLGSSQPVSTFVSHTCPATTTQREQHFGGMAGLPNLPGN